LNPWAATPKGFLMKIAVLIDGGHLRVLARRANKNYDPNLIERVAGSVAASNEQCLRVLYYDCAPYVGKVKLPVSGNELVFSGSDNWLRELASRDMFAVRRGVLKFRGFKPKTIPIAGRALTDDDFKPDFEQKGVDMRIGLDMATFAVSRTVDRIALLTADTDCVPAMKQARIAGLQIILVRSPGQHVAPELLWHADFQRTLEWPTEE
jgi:uncharacterized LabA/DUF88 family protein